MVIQKIKDILHDRLRRIVAEKAGEEYPVWYLFDGIKSVQNKHTA